MKMHLSAFTFCMVLGLTCLSSSTQQAQAPVVKSIKWGEIVVTEPNGSMITHSDAGQSKDAIINPSGSQPWDWSITNMHHNPGIQPIDIEKFIDLANVDIVILTRGMDLILQVPQRTIDWVKQQGKECLVGQSEEMVKKYNELVAQGKRVGGLFHSTC